MLGPGFLTSTPNISPGGIVNAFSGEGGGIAPGEIVSIYGSGLGPLVGVAHQFDPQTGQLPTSGPGVTVTLNGMPAPLFYVHSEQLNIQTPYEVAGATDATLRVTVNGQSTEMTFPVRATHPGVFPRVWNQEGSVNTPDNPARPGSVVVLYATGQGLTNPPSRTGSYPNDIVPEPLAATVLRIGGIEAEILFRGQAPGTTGVMQVNARVPNAPTSGTMPVVLTVGEAASQPGVSIAVR